MNLFDLFDEEGPPCDASAMAAATSAVSSAAPATTTGAGLPPTARPPSGRRASTRNDGPTIPRLRLDSRAYHLPTLIQMAKREEQYEYLAYWCARDCGRMANLVLDEL